MSTERLKEKEQLKKNIQKQASLNEEYITQRHVFDSLKDSFFTSKGFHFIKMEFTNKIKNSTTNIEKVAGTNFTWTLAYFLYSHVGSEYENEPIFIPYHQFYVCTERCYYMFHLTLRWRF